MAKKISLYGILSALCLALGFLEHLIPFDFIAPGIKLGLANSVALLLVAKGDIKGGFLVNTVRILLSALLFSAPSTLIFSLSGGILSLASMVLFKRMQYISLVGLSVISAAVHNLTQLFVAVFLIGEGVLYYLPVLLISACATGALTGFIAGLIFKRYKFN